MPLKNRLANDDVQLATNLWTWGRSHFVVRITLGVLIALSSLAGSSSVMRYVGATGAVWAAWHALDLWRLQREWQRIHSQHPAPVSLDWAHLPVFSRLRRLQGR